MIRLHCSDQEMQQLHDERFHHPHPRVQLKMEVVYLTALGLTRPEVARIARCSPTTVRTYVKAYRDGGIVALQSFRVGGSVSALEEHTVSLREMFAHDPPRSAREAGHRIQALTGLRRSPSQIRAYLRRAGLKYRKVAPIPAKADADRQATFLEETLEPALADAQAGHRHVLFMDAAHFVMGAFLGYLWCFARVFVRTSPGRQRFNVLGALHAVTHEVTTVTNTGYINGQSVVTLLERIREKYGTAPITIVLDNAAYQRCALVRDRAAVLEIELLFLPPYSPNLNLIERLWKFVKAECLNSHYYETFPDFCAAISRCLTETSTVHKTRLDTLLNLKFQRFQSVA